MRKKVIKIINLINTTLKYKDDVCHYLFSESLDKLAICLKEKTLTYEYKLVRYIQKFMKQHNSPPRGYINMLRRIKQKIEELEE